jgi:hypothetical protein
LSIPLPHVIPQHGTRELAFAIWNEFEKDPTKIADFLAHVIKESADKGKSILDACRSVNKSQKNSLPALVANTIAIMCAECQSGKGLEMYLDALKAWEKKHAPSICTINSATEVGRHGDGIRTFNGYSEKIWNLAGLSATLAPSLSVFESFEKEGLKDYEACLDAATRGRQTIPIFAFIDNDKRVDKFAKKVVPIIQTIMGTDAVTGAVNMLVEIDEGDSVVRNAEKKGSKSWMQQVAGKSCLYDASSMIRFVTATPGAVHFSIKMADKTFVYQELTASRNYWHLYLPGEKPPAGAKVIKWVVGDLDDTVRAMASSVDKWCALAIQSTVTDNVDIENAAKRAVYQYGSQVKGFVGTAWMAGKFIAYTSSPDIKKMFDSKTPAFFTCTELDEAEVVKIGRDLKKPTSKKANEHSKADTSLKKGRSKKRNIAETIKKKGRSKKRGRRDHSDEEESDREEPEEEQPEKHASIFRYTPTMSADNDYPAFITFVSEQFENVKKCERKEANQCDDEAFVSDTVPPKILTFAKAVAGRAKSVKGTNHEWPLDELYLDLPLYHSEGIRQAAGRVASTDLRPKEKGPTLRTTPQTQRRLITAIKNHRACSEILRKGKLPIEVIHDMLKRMEALPANATCEDEHGIFSIGARNHTRQGVAIPFADAHDNCRRTKKLKKISFHPKQESVTASTIEIGAPEVFTQGPETSAEAAAAGGEVVQDVPAQASGTSVEAAAAGGGVHPDQVPVPSIMQASTADAEGM